MPLGSLRPVNPPVSPVPSQNSQQAQPTDAEAKQQEAFQELWLKAMTQVKASKDGQKLNEVLQTQRISNLENDQITVTVLFTSLQDEMKRVGLKGKLADMMEDIVPFLNRFAIVGDVAISANPNPAAFPWAAVRFLLLVRDAFPFIDQSCIPRLTCFRILLLDKKSEPKSSKVWLK